MKSLNLLGTGLLCACALLADNTLHVGIPVLDRPTLTALGVQLPITGDDNFNASVLMRYRESGTQNWKNALPLFRVHPENTATWKIIPQFAGSIFDLRPGKTYEIELHASDPDGPADQVVTLTGTTRTVPAGPLAPVIHQVTDNSSLASALQAAQPGDVIVLANGVYYNGPIYFWGSGTATNPIVIRGTSQSGTIIDGNGCSGCNIFEIYGSYVHIENMTLRNAQRAIRFQTAATQGNVVRNVHISNVVLGIGTRENSLDYYIADNILEGRLAWPMVYADDNGAHANDDGINVQGFGHVVAHNVISGFGDAMKTSQQGARAVDFYGNDILWTYDNGLELDDSEGNSRCFRNRFTNTYATISVQPILGGPSYILRNIVVNVTDEQMKFHALGTTPPTETNGVLAYHNTFVSPASDLLMNTPNATHHFRIANNLFVGPAQLPAKAVNWGGPIDDGVFDYDGYYSDGWFIFNFLNLGYQNYPSFAAAQAGGLVEQHGFLLSQPIFANGLSAPASYTVKLAPQDVTLAGNSNAVDRGLVLPNINDGFTGSGPDLGAVETGCPSPIYGPRPVGIDETNEPFGCTALSPAPPIAVAVTPASVSLGQTKQQQFTASVANTTNTGVIWSASPAIGSISQAGLYTAPAVVTSATAVTITAASAADPTKTATAMVNLIPAIAVGVLPPAVSLSQGGQQQFTAQVGNAGNTAVVWSLSPSLGTLTQAGLYTAPTVIAAATKISITATSVADATKTATAIVSLVPPAAVVGVSITPTSVTLGERGQQQFTATVTNASNTAITWSMSPSVGTLTAGGLYTAPATIAAATTVTITATSVADSTKKATAKLSLTPPAVAISISPITVNLTPNRHVQFSARVLNSTNKAVTWSMSPAIGTLTNSGLYTAPAAITARVTVTITATSAADQTKSAAAHVNLASH